MRRSRFKPFVLRHTTHRCLGASGFRVNLDYDIFTGHINFIRDRYYAADIASYLDAKHLALQTRS
jgi:hypothetical protein